MNTYEVSLSADDPPSRVYYHLLKENSGVSVWIRWEFAPLGYGVHGIRAAGIWGYIVFHYTYSLWRRVHCLAEHSPLCCIKVFVFWGGVCGLVSAVRNIMVCTRWVSLLTAFTNPTESYTTQYYLTEWPYQKLVSQSLGQSVSQSFDHSVSPSVSQLLSQSVSQSVSQSPGQSVSQSPGQSVSK